MSEVYEVEIPQLVLTSEVDVNVENGKGGIRLDWSSYDILDKYFVVYRKQEGEEEWKTIVSLDEKFNGSNFIDNLANDKNSPTGPDINIEGNQENNSIEITTKATDKGNEYSYYIEAYDINSMKLLSKSNLIMD